VAGPAVATMPRALLLALLLLGIGTPASAGSRALARQCKRTCGPTISGCTAGGQRRGVCRRTTLKRCRREGIGVCLPAITYLVDPTGTDALTCGTPDAPCRTLQFVVDLIPSGGSGTLKVAAGTYSDLHPCAAETAATQDVLCILNKQVTMTGGFVPPNWDTPVNDPSATVIDGQNTGRAIHIARTESTAPMASLAIDGFTIQNGRAQGASSGDVSQTYAFGGGMYAQHAALTLHNLVFQNNTVVGGSTTQAEGGRGVGGGLAINNYTWSVGTAVVDLQNVTFQGNTATGGSGSDHGGYALGGGMFSYYATVTGDTLTFDGNTATGGPTQGDGSGNGDKSDALGGGLSAERFSTVSLQHVHAINNTATGGAAPNGDAGAGYGAGLYAEGATLSVTDAVVEQNLAHGGDGHNPTTTGSLANGGGVFTVSSTLTLDRVVVVDNEAHAGDGVVNGGASGGGGVAITLGSGPGIDVPFAIRNCVIADNAASTGAGTFVGGGGGGIFVQASTGTIDQTTVANNRLNGDHLLGGGIAVANIAGWQAVTTLNNSILANHTSASFDPSAYFDAALYVVQGATANVGNILFANNRHDSNMGISGGWNPPPGTITMTGVVTAADAKFVSPGSPNQDYHLAPGSAAIDHASGSLTVDADGNPRPVGAAPDLGAYEYTP